MADRSSDCRSSLVAVGRPPPPRLSVSQGLGDDVGLEPLGVSDGFAPQSLPSHGRSTTLSHVPSGGPSAVRPLSHNSILNPPPQTSTTTEPSGQQGGRSSFALRSDAFANQVSPRRTQSVATVSTVSNDTSFTISRTVSPFQGLSQPTHPYAMYPQGTGFPSPELSVASAVRLPDQAYVGASGPTHPYGMYPQNTVPEGADTSDSAPALSIPVGFPGLGQNYQRRLGPEGEEAGDIIGPDGHTEQLPPYTRYPDGIPPKGRTAGAGGASGSRALYTGTTSEYGPSRSQVSVNMPQSRLSVRSVMSDSSQARLNAAGVGESDASGSLKERLAGKGKKRICRGKIPLWWVVIAVLLSVLLVGGTAGGLFARHREREKLLSPHPKPQSTVFATVTTTLDASPIPTRPPHIPPLPTGTSWVVSVNVVDSSNECLTSPLELNTWSCSPPSNFQNLQVEITSDVSGGYGMIRLVSIDGPQSLKYGAQPPVFDVSRDVQMAMDIYDPGRGPAYFFHLMYDKIVILHEADLAPSSPTQSPSKRGIGEDHKRRDQDDDLTDMGDDDSSIGIPDLGSYQGMSRKAKPGELVWVCVWNNTLLEGFIFITQTAGNSSSLASSTASATISTSTATSSALSPSSTLTPYPFVFKIEERRIPASQNQPEPYCRKMRVMGDSYSMQPVLSSTGGLIIDTLDECKPWSRTRRRLANRDSNLSRLRGRDDDYPTCRCEWISS